MKTLISFEVTIETDRPFSQGGRERRAAAARSLRKLFESREWAAEDEPIAAVFDAVAIERRFRDRDEGARVRVRETQLSAERPLRDEAAGGPSSLRLVSKNDGPSPRRREELRAMAKEALLYLEAVSLAFADRDILGPGGREGAPGFYRGLIPWSEEARRAACARSSTVCADLAALLDGRAPSDEETAADAPFLLDLIADTFGRLRQEPGNSRRILGDRHFRAAAEWSGRPRRVRGVYRTDVWEAMIREFAHDLGAEESAFVLESVRSQGTVWSAGLSFTARFFPLCLELFRLAAEEGGLLPADSALESEAAAGGFQALRLAQP